MNRRRAMGALAAVLPATLLGCSVKPRALPPTDDPAPAEKTTEGYGYTTNRPYKHIVSSAACDSGPRYYISHGEVLWSVHA